MIRFNHCANQMLYNGRTDILFLRTHAKDEYPWGVTKDGTVLCSRQSSTRVVHFQQSRLVPGGEAYEPKDLHMPPVFCSNTRRDGQCSTGMHVLLEILSTNATSSVTLVGFTSHRQDDWQSRFHDFPNENRLLYALKASEKVRKIGCLAESGAPGAAAAGSLGGLVSDDRQAVAATSTRWHGVVAQQMAPWDARGYLDVDALLEQTRHMTRAPSVTNPLPVVALVDSDGWKVKKINRWVVHHHSRFMAVLNLFRMTQRRAKMPLPRIRFLVVVSDGRGTVSPDFDQSCTCTKELNCCDLNVTAAAADAPPAPLFATNVCRHSWDVSIPVCIDDLLDTRTEQTINASIARWVDLGASVPWQDREPRAFFVGDTKGYRSRVHLAARNARPLLSSQPPPVPFENHTQFKATIFAHGYHFNSVRWRRLALLHSAVIAEEAPCKEWWNVNDAQQWVHYAPTTETFSDLPATASRLLDPSFDVEAQRMAQRLFELGMEAFSVEGLTGYIETLWRHYARLQR